MKLCTSLEQSKKLVELGIDINTADLWYAERYEGHVELNGKWIIAEEPYYYLSLSKPSERNWSQDLIKDIPCWSLAALIDILPISIEFKGDKYYLRFMKEYIEYANDEISLTGIYLHTTGNNNLVDACYEMILKLKEQKLL